MRLDVTKEEIFKRYLLDECSEDEREQIEERFMSDDEAFDEMLAFEDELYLEYAAGELSADEQAVFERKFLNDREGRSQLAFAEAFNETAADMAKERTFVSEAVVAPAEKISYLKSFFSIFSLNTALQFGAAAAVLLLTIGLIALLFQNSRLRSHVAQTQQENERQRREIESQLAEKERQRQEIERQLTAEREKNNGSDERIRELENERKNLETEIRDRRRSIEQTPVQPESVRRPTLATLILSPGVMTRDNGTPMNRVDLTGGVKAVNLRLQLKNADDYERFSTSVLTVDDNSVVQSQSNISARGKGKSRSIPLNIPSVKLKRADYQVVLSGITNDGKSEEITRYYFSVDK